MDVHSVPVHDAFVKIEEHLDIPPPVRAQIGYQLLDVSLLLEHDQAEAPPLLLVLPSVVRPFLDGVLHIAHLLLVSVLGVPERVQELAVFHPHLLVQHRRITPFVRKQLEISRVFGFPVPEGCDTKYKSKKVSEKRRERPKKAKVVN